MDIGHLIFLSLAIGVIAFLYSCVGHAGASGYIAVMTLFGLVTTTIRPSALVLNILVAIIASFQFLRAGHFSWKLFWPFALLSVPAAYFGGYLQLPARVLKIIIGLVLLFSAARLFFRRGDPPAVTSPPLPAALAVGSGIGFLSGLAGFVSARQSIPAVAFILSAAAIVGGAIGSYLGSRKFPVRTVSILLATVLVIAG